MSVWTSVARSFVRNQVCRFQIHVCVFRFTEIVKRAAASRRRKIFSVASMLVRVLGERIRAWLSSSFRDSAEFILQASGFPFICAGFLRKLHLEAGVFFRFHCGPCENFSPNRYLQSSYDVDIFQEKKSFGRMDVHHVGL